MNATKAVSPYVKSLPIALLALLIAACGGEEPDANPNSNPSSGTETFTVTFQTNEGTPVPAQQKVAKDTTAAEPQAPAREGYTFAGWFTDAAFENAFDFDTPIAANIVLYARWEKIPDTFWIPDDNFRDTLKALIPEAFDSGDSLIAQHADVMGLAILKIGSSSIADLAGIEYFTALTQLYCSDNELTKLEVSQNTTLTQLACSFNQLTVLDVSQNAFLTVLECNNNRLTSLDVSQNAALENLLCQNNKLTGLNVSQNASLTILECNHNQLTGLNLSQNASLTGLSCHSNRLTGLDVSQNAALTWLFCYDNALTELDIRGMRSAGFVGALQVHGSATFNPLNTLSVHERLQDHAELKKTKRQRGDSLIIAIYSAADGATDYTLVCSDYDPISETCLSTVSRPNFTVTFALNGGAGSIGSLTVEQGQTAARPNSDPTRNGYTFAGWFTDKDTLQNKFDFGAAITGDLTLYAKWEKIPKFWVPDDHFRNKLTSLIPAAFDSSDSLLIQHADVMERTRLNVSSSKIADLTGIAYFTALTELTCHNNLLTHLDISQNAALKKLTCRSNQLTTLDVSQNTALTELACYDNQLTSLDMRGMRSTDVLRINASLITNRLTSLKTHENAQDHKEIREVKTRQRAALTIATYSAADGSTAYALVCGDYDPNAGTCLSTDAKPDFTVTFALNGGEGSIDALTVEQGQTAARPNPDPVRDGYTFAGWFTDKDTLQNKFDFGAAITGDLTLYAKWEKIPKFWVPDNRFRNKLKGLIPAAFDGSDSLLIRHADVMERTRLNVSSSKIADLTGIAYFTALTNLNCFNNNLTALDVSQNVALTLLNCGRNRLTHLDVSQHTALTSLSCDNNRLTTLDVSQNDTLTELNCRSNQLTSLDVSQHTALTKLYCYLNKLTTLDVSQTPALQLLWCYENRLTALDLAKSPVLKKLLCQGNPLTALDIRGMRSGALQLPTIAATSNRIRTLKVHENLQEHKEVKKVKAQRGGQVTIATYRAAAGSTDYTLVCGDYNPNTDSCAATP